MDIIFGRFTFINEFLTFCISPSSIEKSYIDIELGLLSHIKKQDNNFSLKL